MATNLSNLRAPKKANTNRKRVGRGMGSGMGKTSTRGHKGQGSRSGSSLMRGFEGGQMPLHRRLPKRGFTNIFKKEYAVINIGRLETLPGDSFSPETLKKSGIVKKIGDGLKILAGGELKRAIHVEANLFSEDAEKKIIAAGGTVKKIDAHVVTPKERGSGRSATVRREAIQRAAGRTAKVAKPAAAKPAAKKPGAKKA